MTPTLGLTMRRRATARRAVTMLVAAATVAGCSGGGSAHTVGTTPTTDTAHTAPATPASPQVAYGAAVSARLSPNGVADLHLSLDMYATAYGHAQELGATPLVGQAVEGTQALIAVLGHWSELTPAQQAVITGDLDTKPVSSIVVHPTATAKGGASRHVSRPRYDDPLQTMADELAGEIGAHWSVPLTAVPRLDRMGADLPATPGHGPPLADTLSLTTTGEPVVLPAQYTTCRIRLFPAYFRASELEQRATLAHEVFHCYQFIGRDAFVLARIGQWVVEGQAEWVGATIAGGGEVVAGWWDFWMDNSLSLGRRTYDAVGFYFALSNDGVDVWPAFAAMLDATPDFAHQYAAAVGGLGTAFMGTVAVAHAGVPDVGPPWIPQGPEAPTTRVEATPTPVATGGQFTQTLELKSFDTSRVAAHLDDPVAAVTSDVAPWAAGAADHGAVQTSPGAVALCLRSECLCPDGRPLATASVGEHPDIAVGVADATAVGQTAHVKIEGITLDAACARFGRASTTPDACLAGHWKLVSQVFGGEFMPGITLAGLHGGIGGRTLVITPEGTYTISDDGSDPTRGSTDLGGVSVETTVTITGRVEGTVSASGDHALFQSSSAALHMHLVELVTGAAPIVIDQDFTDPSPFGNGEATVTCTGDTLALAFTNATFNFQPAG